MRVELQPESAKTHLHQRFGRRESIPQRRLEWPRLSADQPEPLLRQVPVHGQIEWTAEQKLSAAVSLMGGFRMGPERLAVWAIDVIPAEVAHPHQWCPQPTGQIGCRGWDISKNQNRPALSFDPGRFLLDQFRQLPLQLLQSDECSCSIHPKGIRLSRSHIPAATANTDRCAAEQQAKEP